MNKKKAKGLRKLAAKTYFNSNGMTDAKTIYKQMKKSYKQAKGQQ